MESAALNEHGHSDDDSFEDAQELHSANDTNIPTTRVEKTDDNPSFGEVPGTDAYEMRTSDAVPDQLEVVPEGTRSRSSSVDQSGSRGSSSSRRPSVPKTVVEKVDPAHPSHGEVPGTEAFAQRQADAAPDEVLEAPENARSPTSGTPTSSIHRSEPPELQANLANPNATEPEGNPGAGDDFDDFEEGGDDDDFGEFDEAYLAEESIPQSAPPATTAKPHQLLDFDGLNSVDEITAACEPFIHQIFRDVPRQTDEDTAPVGNSFLNERSHSLWSQLVAPPALQPPNWVKSRTRRLFLVSLGVPVDLDEILPASKQKRLVLPSIDIEQERHASQKESQAANHAVSKLKHQNRSSTSIDRPSSRSEKKRKGPAPPPEFNENVARLMCSTTTQALTNLSDEELQSHKVQLEQLKKSASETLEFWLIQRDSAKGDKEAFEEVIQNLVKHAQKVRT